MLALVLLTWRLVIMVLFILGLLVLVLVNVLLRGVMLLISTLPAYMRVAGPSDGSSLGGLQS